MELTSVLSTYATTRRTFHAVRRLTALPRQPALRAAAAAAATLGLLGVRHDLARLVPDKYAPAVAAAVLAAAALIGALAIRNGVGALTHGLDSQAAVTIRNLGTWTLYVLLGIAMASALGFNLSGLLVGGAILGVIVAAGSQASLGNFFAGLVLMLGRPYRVGSSIRLRGPGLGTSEYEGTVSDMNALYTTLRTAAGEVVKVPNSAVVTSAVMLGGAPLQADLDVALPPGTALRPIEAALRERIGPGTAAVTIRPRLLESGSDGKLACQVQVRSMTAVDPAVVVEALAVALASAESG